jgi:hypothetical protein
VKIRIRAAVVASAIAVAAAMGLAFAGAAGASPAHSLARDRATTSYICDQETGDCWTNNGKNNFLLLTGATAYAPVYCGEVNINGSYRETCELKVYGSGVPGLCVETSPGTDTYEEPCADPAIPAEEFWYTPSDALYALGVSEAENQDWCELDIHGDVQNGRCTAPDVQPADMTFPGISWP